jgi:hypothetical protein
MSDFKDWVAADIANVFLNLDEFAEEHSINGANVPVILDRDRLNERRDKAGLTGEELYFFVAAHDLPVRPKTGETMRFDRRIYEITECLENDGVLEIALLRQNAGG